MQRPLRILQVSTADLGGGAEGSGWNLFQAYRARGHNSWLAVGYKCNNDPDVLLIPNHISRCTTNRLRRFRSGLERRLGIENFLFPRTWHLLKLTPKPPDIIHCHNLHVNYFDLRVLPWLSHQVPVILNLRDAWLLSGHCAHSFDCQRWKIGCGQCPNLTSYPAIRRDATAYNWQRKRRIYEKSRFYISTPSQWLMDKVKTSMLRGVQYRVIPNGIDLTVFQPGNQKEARRTLNLPSDAKIILMIAHNKFKDYDTMERALGLLDKSYGDKLIFVCLGKTGADKPVGEGRMVYREFEFNQKRTALYYRASDVFIHAAKDETFGKTLTEALACGIPVVATAVGGIAEQIKNGKTGFLVPAKDSYSMSEAIERLLADSNLRSSMGQAGVKDTRQRFGLERQVDAFLTWYQEILGNGHSSPPFYGRG